ncbi:hypothetical protein GALMADRAFT_1211089 [Galerina marginata CBS 339.88]|uniref:Uncharacterized protein n=1 Tax=Galerina marginata (strain CBS 339.88) TaxID=685588 RepID=A0A067S5E2_GALM3|nr:hypothetical protein GALMADRAFT_1211089 [Galerina marginata CBS 339.88]
MGDFSVNFLSEAELDVSFFRLLSIFVELFNGLSFRLPKSNLSVLFFSSFLFLCLCSSLNVIWASMPKASCGANIPKMKVTD